MIKKLFAFLTVLCLFLGCSKDLHVQIPSYIQIDSYKTKVNNRQGTSNQNFTDMLVFANGQTYGTYPLGAKIPVLTNGPTSFIIRGVVRMNGLDLLRADYEVMKGCDTVINVTPGQVTHIVPVFEYFSTAQFAWINGFEGGSANDSCSSSCGQLVSSYTGHPETAFTFTPGFSNTSLALRPNDSCCTYASVQSTNRIGLPSGGVGVYLELNYQSSMVVQIYISGDGGTTQTDCGGILPSPTWKKMYINLTEQVSSLQSTQGYILYFVASYDGNPNDQANLDDIKIVTAAP